MRTSTGDPKKTISAASGRHVDCRAQHVPVRCWTHSLPSCFLGLPHSLETSEKEIHSKGRETCGGKSGGLQTKATATDNCIAWRIWVEMMRLRGHRVAWCRPHAPSFAVHLPHNPSTPWTKGQILHRAAPATIWTQLRAGAATQKGTECRNPEERHPAQWTTWKRPWRSAGRSSQDQQAIQSLQSNRRKVAVSALQFIKSLPGQQWPVSSTPCASLTALPCWTAGLSTTFFCEALDIRQSSRSRQL